MRHGFCTCSFTIYSFTHGQQGAGTRAPHSLTQRACSAQTVRRTRGPRASGLGDVRRHLGFRTPPRTPRHRPPPRRGGGREQKREHEGANWRLCINRRAERQPPKHGREDAEGVHKIILKNQRDTNNSTCERPHENLRYLYDIYLNCRRHV